MTPKEFSALEGSNVKVISLSYDTIDQGVTDEPYTEKEYKGDLKYVGRIGFLDNVGELVGVVRFENGAEIYVSIYDVEETSEPLSPAEILPSAKTTKKESNDGYAPLTQEEKDFADKMFPYVYEKDCNIQEAWAIACYIALKRTENFSMLWSQEG
jgi:hypothetical protein